MSRRAVCCGGAALAFCCLPELRAQAERLRREPLDVVEVAPGLHVTQGVHQEATPENQGAIANIGFIVGEASVAVVDTGGCRLWAERLREAIRRVTALPISHVVLTHMHPDHVYGAAAFLEDKPEILGHRNLPRALASRRAFYDRRLAEALGELAQGSVLVPPTRTIDDTAEIDLGGRVLTLSAHPAAHTDNDLSLVDRRTGILWAGDLLFIDRTPALDGSLLGWIAVGEALRRSPAPQVVPGHGPRLAAWPMALDAQQRYLTLLRDEVRRVLRAGGTIEEAVATVGKGEAGRWRLFDDYHPHNIVAAYRELEWE